MTTGINASKLSCLCQLAVLQGKANLWLWRCRARRGKALLLKPSKAQLGGSSAVQSPKAAWEFTHDNLTFNSPDAQAVGCDTAGQRSHLAAEGPLRLRW